MNYKEQLRDPRWKALAKFIRTRDGNKCVVCDSTNKLNVHHKKYTGMAWEAPATDLITLCEDCHAKFHLKYKAPSDKDIVKDVPKTQKKKKLTNADRREKRKNKEIKIKRASNRLASTNKYEVVVNALATAGVEDRFYKPYDNHILFEVGEDMYRFYPNKIKLFVQEQKNREWITFETLESFTTFIYKKCKRADKRNDASKQ